MINQTPQQNVEGLEYVMKHGRAIFRKMMRVAETEGNKVLEAAAQTQKSWLDILYDLHYETGTKQQAAFAKAKPHFDELSEAVFGQGEDIAKAKQMVLKETMQVTERLNRIRNGSTAPKVFPQGAKKVEEVVEQSPGFVNRLVEGAGYVAENTLGSHQKWLNEQSTGKKMAFAVGYMAVGSLLTDLGVKMASQGFSGVKEETVQQIDDQGNRSILILKKPLPAAERVVKAVIGSGSIAAGITGTGLGFYNLFSAM
jgi:hypothetical protein